MARGLTRILRALSGPGRYLLALVVVAVTASAAGSSADGVSAAVQCRPTVTAAYAAHVRRATASGRDVWGERVLRARGGPTYERALRFLHPILLAEGSDGELTTTGVHYVPFSQPFGVQGAGSVALHVADGSEVIANRVGGESLGVFVGRERYGSCLGRLTLPRLAEGYLPILRTAYRDARGDGHEQESFAARSGATLASYVHVPDGARFTAGGASVIATHVRWPLRGRPIPIDAAAYDAARAAVVEYWQRRLAEGVTLEVPEQVVMDAQRALLVQNLGLTWRYSIGNAYEQFSFPESPDNAEVAAEYGHDGVARSILRTSLTRRPVPYPNWKMGDRLLATALHYRLYADRAHVRLMTPALRGYVVALGRQIESNPLGLLDRERFSSDIPDSVYGLHSQAVVWQGLREMARVWQATGDGEVAAAARRHAARLEPAVRRAVRASVRRLPDGSLFVPVRLLDDETPYRHLTASRPGSYWNLVAHYAFASGLFSPGSREARGALRFMLGHGSRLLGLVRASAFALYDTPSFPTSGTDHVYGLAQARFLADNDEADQLVLSLYGQLAAGMTPGTFVAGEAASVTPLRGNWFRSMYNPPSSATNATFLETLRLLLVHETRDGAGAPRGLELAFSTPRAWLEPGKRIVVARVPTSFGRLSYSLEARAGSVAATVEVPSRPRPRTLALRLRLPAGRRITSVKLDGSSFSRFNARTGTVDLSGVAGTVELDARYANP